ncbi:PAS domain S-box protein [Methylohalobius crimeensis]|uniref:PAS domain S-box protein n=1 Tax=Methylohalobius crimeensis TaxID=244365 RepID=UPI0003B68089|nr:PAS domain S-box protein [Methylohalobius crimeensis]
MQSDELSQPEWLVKYLDTLPAVVFLLEAEDDPRQRLRTVYLSAYAEELLGADAKPHLDAQAWLFDRAHPEDAKQWRNKWLDTPSGAVLEHEYRLKIATEQYAWIRCQVRRADRAGKPSMFAGILIETNRKRSLAEALADFNTPLRTVIDLVPHMIFAKDAEGRFLLANQALAEAHATTPREIIGKTNPELPGAEKEFPKFLRDEQEVLRTGQPMYVPEESFTTASGETRILETRMLPFLPEGEELPAVLGVAVDITAPKRVKQELERSKKRLRHILDASPAAIYTLRPTGNLESPFQVTMISAGIESIVGYKAEAWLSQPTFWVDHLHPEDRQEALSRQRILLETGMLDHEYRFLHKDGNYRWIHDKLRLIRDEDSNLEEVVGCWMDLTGHKEMDNALRESEARFRGAFETAVNGMALLSPEGRWQQVNEALCQMLGYSQQELLAQNFQAITHPDDLACDLENLNRLLRGEIDSYHMEKRLLHKSGEPVWVQKSATTVTNSHQLLHVLAQIQDISARKEAEIALLKAKEAAEAGNRAKMLFLANVSHELRTPLNGIIGFAQVLQKKNTLAAEDQEIVHHIAQCGDYLLGLINDLLDFTKADTEMLTLQPKDFDFPGLIHEICEIFQMNASEKHIRFEFQPLTPLPRRVSGDHKRLRQVLINILGNAVKFTHAGGVSFRVGYGGKTARFMIEDTGIGIEPRYLDKIFEPYEQASAKKMGLGGAGLGLAISKKIVDLMEGELEVSSQPGKGTLFKIELPLPSSPGEEPDHYLAPADAVAEIPGASTKVAPPRPRSMISRRFFDRIFLIADDNEINRTVLRKLLVDYGAQVLEAANGEEAVTLIRKIPFDLIFLDLRMPAMDGIEVMQWIQSNASPNAQTPVLAITAHALSEQSPMPRETGFVDCLIKPVSDQELYTAIDRCLHLGETTRPAPKNETPSPSAPRTAEDFAATLLRHTNGNGQLSSLLFRKLCKELPGQMSATREALMGGDLVRAREISHKILGSMSICGFGDIKRSVAELEAKIVADDHPAAMDAFERADERIKRLIEMARDILRFLEEAMYSPR